MQHYLLKQHDDCIRRKTVCIYTYLHLYYEEFSEDFLKTIWQLGYNSTIKFKHHLSCFL